ncbi:hypothetical protein OEA41_001521 [Lepraria neglecta]|uniref:Uncharacterized protein n=1 Tax=Lepraria neglecta TaxID=209136 RepID=A0AAD9ZCJ2_9LECA|nr:hypothetical protein OEA41_001521 [Lepraria neglecta]
MTKIKETLYLQAVDRPAHPDFVQAVVELYSKIFEYQARLLCFLSQRSPERGFRGTLKLDDWEGMLKKVQTSDNKCTRYCELYDRDEERRRYEEESCYMLKSVDIQKRVLKMLETSQAQRHQDRRDDQEAELLETLASDYKSDKDLVSTRVPRTCEWFFEDDRFLEWRDSNFSRLLWVSAGPGCGKSVLARALIDERRVCTNTMTSTVCYFFFKDGQEQRTRGANALGALLHQLFENTALITHALSSYRSYGKKLRDAFSELWEILVKSAEDSEAGEIICILDALDECEKNARNQLIEKLVHFFSRGESCQNPSLKLKFLVTSRPYDDLEQNFQRLSGVSTYVHFDGDDKSQKIGQEINLVIDARIPYITGDFNDEDRKRISNRLKEMGNRTYLWLFLIIDIIEKSPSNFRRISSIDSLLSDLPSEVSDAYEVILSRSKDEVKARILLQLIVAATRPLSLEEANMALTIATRAESCRSQRALELWPLQSFTTTVQNMCGLFVSVHDGKLSLIHQTAREFLIRTSKSGSAHSHKWKGCLDMATAHGTISRICLDYLNFQDVASTHQSQLGQGRHAEPKNECYLLDYAANNWAAHYTSQPAELAKDSQKAAKKLCNTSSPPGYWFPLYCGSSYMEPSGWTELGIASLLGLTYVTEGFLNEGADVNAQGGDYGNALQAASYRGHDRVVQILLDKRADINAQGGGYGNALQAASYGGYDRVVQILLDKGADINAQGGAYGNALQAASSGGYDRVVQILLDKGADINAQGGYYGNALQAASFGGHDRVVQILLDKGADINAQGGDNGNAQGGDDGNAQRGAYGNALQAASSGGYDRIVQMLLDKGADINAQGGRYGNALQAASSGGYNRIVQMLLHKGADINAQGGGYSNALQAASSGGYDRVVQMLLDKGADINAQGGAYGNALQAASYEGHDRIVQMLLDKGADINAQGGDYSNALQAASCRGHDRVVEMLLDKGADINAQGGGYGNALQAASSGGYDRIVQMLLDKGADINAQGGYYGNALQAASYEGHDRVVQMLLHKGADINAQGGGYSNALQAASFGGHDRVVQMLLDKGADINAQGGRYSNALQAASFGGHDRVVQILLDKGADINTQGGDYSNALQAASFGGYNRIVQMLLDKGADINAQGGRYSNALQAASYEGHDRVVQMLLDKGANINTQGGRYSNALQAASYEGHDRVVQMLLDKGADINAQGGYYSNALQAASFGGHDRVVEMLLDKGADINAQGGRYGNALQAASYEGHDRIVQMLLDKGADINAQGGRYGNALQAASFGGYNRVVHILLEKGVDINQKDLHGRTALHLASARGHKAIVETFFRLASDPSFTDMQGRNCLHFAASNGSTELVRWLLREGFDPNLTDRDGWTPMHWAARDGSIDTIRVLKDEGAVSSIEAINWWNPRSVAVYHHKESSAIPTTTATCGTLQSGPALIPTFSSSNLEVDSTSEGNKISPGVFQEGVYCDGCFLVS